MCLNTGSAPEPAAPEGHHRLHVSRSQQEVLEALQRMGCSGMQVRGFQQYCQQAVAASILLRMDPAVLTTLDGEVPRLFFFMVAHT